MKKIILPIAFLFIALSGSAQKVFTKSGKVYFNASGPLETIDATNEKATCVLDVATGSLDVAILMKAFTFTRSLMQEHFNENYVESDKFPKATFKGTISDIASVNLKKDGEYPVKIKGDMTMHGVTKPLETTGSLTVKDGQISSGKSNFKLLLTDYNIEIPSVVKDKISKDVKITVDVNYQPFKSGTN